MNKQINEKPDRKADGKKIELKMKGKNTRKCIIKGILRARKRR